MAEVTRARLPEAGDRLPVDYDRPPTHERMIAQKDVAVPMRDGVNLSVDIYRPDTTEKFPALLAFAIYNKDLQGPEVPTRCRRNRHGPRSGPAPWKPATPSSLSRAAMSMSSVRRAASANRMAADRANGTATI